MGQKEGLACDQGMTKSRSVNVGRAFVYLGHYPDSKEYHQPQPWMQFSSQGLVWQNIQEPLTLYSYALQELIAIKSALDIMHLSKSN